MIRKTVLVEVDSEGTIGLVLCDPYMTVITTKEPGRQKTILSSDVRVVDILVDGVLYKKVPVDNLKRVR